MAFSVGASASASAAGVGLGGSGAAAASASAAFSGAINLGLLSFLGGRGGFGGRGGGGRRGGGRGGRRGGGGGGGGGGIFFTRFVRDVGEEEDEETHNRLLEVVSEQDESGCGKRLVCELAAAEAEDERELLEEELAILEFVGDLVPGEDLRAQGAALDYKLAKAQGMEGRDCGLLYPSCIYNGTEIMTSVLAYLS
ncbi:uncharacterized protein [Penaeus vannamei]|uniref:uncharacterized protein n=1 Tax=Penaeus vannamei TaxID=6689 RepID=UPI00387F8B21